MNIKKWRIAEEDRASVEKIVAALDGVDPMFVARACGIVIGNVLADKSLAEGSGSEFADPYEGLVIITEATQTLIQIRTRN